MLKLILSLLVAGFTFYSSACFAEVIVKEVTDTLVIIQWTAPGDDGALGTAAIYDVRYSTSPITDSLSWNNAVQQLNEPAPDSAGTIQVDTITGLAPNTLYFIGIKTADEVPNWSGISNIVAALTVDRVPPCDITDCEVIGP